MLELLRTSIFILFHKLLEQRLLKEQKNVGEGQLLARSQRMQQRKALRAKSRLVECRRRDNRKQRWKCRTLFAAQSREFNFLHMLNDDKRRGIIPINNEIEFNFAILLLAIRNTPQPRSFLVVASQWYGHAIRTT